MKLKLQLFPNFILTQLFLLFSPIGNIQTDFLAWQASHCWQPAWEGAVQSGVGAVRVPLIFCLTLEVSICFERSQAQT